jgi:hypothetical protein
MAYGATADWYVDMVDCGIVIEEKATFRHAASRWLENAASHLATIATGHPGRYRVLWLTRNAGSANTRNVSSLTAPWLPDEEFFRQHPCVDGVVAADVDDVKAQARLAVNSYTKRGPQLASSAFAALLGNVRYFPVEFPTDIAPGIVSGAQPKLLLRRNADGTYSSSRRSAQELKVRLDVAADIVVQLGAYFQRKKSEHPDWADEKNLERIRLGLQAKAIDGKWPFTQAEQRWIMARLRELCFDTSQTT